MAEPSASVQGRRIRNFSISHSVSMAEAVQRSITSRAGMPKTAMAAASAGTSAIITFHIFFLTESEE